MTSQLENKYKHKISAEKKEKIIKAYVEENFRYQGVGKKLIKFALTQKYPPKYKYFSVTHSKKQPWLTKYYEDFGFKVAGKTEVGNIKLTKSLRRN